MSDERNAPTTDSGGRSAALSAEVEWVREAERAMVDAQADVDAALAAVRTAQLRKHRLGQIAGNRRAEVYGFGYVPHPSAGTEMP